MLAGDPVERLNEPLLPVPWVTPVKHLDKFTGVGHVIGSAVNGSDALKVSSLLISKVGFPSLPLP